jgi:hypothetical protein
METVTVAGEWTLAAIPKNPARHAAGNTLNPQFEVAARRVTGGCGRRSWCDEEGGDR